MNSPTQELLDDLMNDRPAAFDDDLLTGTLAAVRRRRFQRRAGQSLTVLAVVLAMAICWRKFFSPSTPLIATVSKPPAPGYLVHTTPLLADEMVFTHSAGLAVIKSSPDESLVVKTVPSPDLYQKLTDKELMVLLAGHDAVIVRQPGKPAMLLLDGKPVGARFDVN